MEQLRSGSLFKKEIFCIEDGKCLGTADELLIDYFPGESGAGGAYGSASVKALLVRGRPRFFGLFGRDPDLTINWTDVLVIGEDAIFIRGSDQAGGRTDGRINGGGEDGKDG